MAGMMNFSKLLEKIDEVTKKKTFSDGSENYWRMTKDKAGNATAVIRFLPSKNIDDIPFVRLYTHGWKSAENRWYIENSLSSIGQPDYIGEKNSELWNSGLEENKEIARARKRKLNYISNILIIKDPEAPENEGQVKLFKYGSKIFNKIIEAAKPDESLGEDPINVFDPESGADFSLRQTIVAGFPNYDSSKFGSRKPIAGGAKKIEETLAKCFDVNEEVAPDKFKTYDELKKKYLWCINEEDTSKSESTYDKELDQLSKLAAEPEQPAKVTKTKSPPMPTVSKEDTDTSDSAFFASLLED